MWRAILVLIGVLAWAAAAAGAAGNATTLVDRAVVRFDAPETGGIAHPRFVFERELAFEARLEALGDSDRTERAAPYLDHSGSRWCSDGTIRSGEPHAVTSSGGGAQTSAVRQPASRPAMTSNL